MGGKSGFTLIEILVGLVILVMLAGLVEGIYVSVAKNREAATQKTAMVHSASTVLGRIADELASAFVDLNRPDSTLFKLSTDGSGNSTLEFTTLLPAVHGLRAGGETRLRYEVRPDPESETRGAVILSRAETDDPQKDIGRDSVTYDMLKGIIRFTVTVYDGTKWVDRWENDSLKGAVVPAAVRLTAAWGESGHEEVMRTAATIYSYVPPAGAKP